MGLPQRGSGGFTECECGLLNSCDVERFRTVTSCLTDALPSVHV